MKRHLTTIHTAPTTILTALLTILLATTLAASCNNTEPQAGRPFDELPAVQKSDVLAFFQALPAEDLPERLASPEARDRYFKAFRDMTEFGALADGEGPEQTALTTDNAVFWSDYLDMQDGYEPAGDDNTPHPYANLYTFAGTEEGKFFGVLKSGAYIDGEDKANPTKYYWLDTASGKLSPGKLYLTPKYTTDDLTANPLLTYGAPNLYYAIKNNDIVESYYDRGMDVIIEDVGKTDIMYEWNGVGFVRCTGKLLYCIYNYAFAGMLLGEKVPYSVPGYTTNVISAAEYESIFYLVKGGETEPTLIFHSGMDDTLTMIEVCKGPYCNPYGFYPGMPVADLLKTSDEIYARTSDYDSFSIDDETEDDFVSIYCHFDEDFFYKVPKSQYLGGADFTPDAKVARIVIINAVG